MFDQECESLKKQCRSKGNTFYNILQEPATQIHFLHLLGIAGSVVIFDEGGGDPVQPGLKILNVEELLC